MNVPHIKWAIVTLSHMGYRLKKIRYEIVQETAWSQVYRFHTNQGLVYLKKVPPALSLEPDVIQLLDKQFHGHVPHILAQNKEQHCFLMQDAGVPLHDYFKQGYNAEVLIETMQHYSELQLCTADNIECFFNLGVPDWRLQRLPNLYRELLNEEQLLLGDGITANELELLKGLDKKIQTICDQLAQYNIPDTFGHADFHDKNILVNPSTHQTTLIDLGEVVITHPFFSLVNCIYRSTEPFKLPSSQYRQLMEACFRQWLSRESSIHLFEMIKLIEQCWSVHAVLGEYRLIRSIEPTASMSLSRQGRFAEKLRAWMSAQ
ncbi:phosphotransferase [Legionella waltersii]|uniref:Phosphotransferase enzyme family protein n=1 Tax=Legionella waltersii TaxID=66969 RepID=A0A0W1A0Q5_9GAMM|nr:phosphotransferase [Legionella waltersii]KTD74951.1 Phosphotransferase enzyme family protein [Legionella waltersii]SNV08532.1 Predicted phosphotransferase related to Ser/Thr protein kinases [Legionella waltersii]